MAEIRGREWRQWTDCRVVVVDAKRREFMECIGRTGRVRHNDDVLGEWYYLSFDDGGSADSTEVIIEPAATAELTTNDGPTDG